jgi:RimJ/RimL family protein N-acetyltransferase
MGGNPFEGERWVLRALEPTDAVALQAIWNEASILGRRYLPWGIPDIAPMSRAQVDAALEAWSKEKRAMTLGIALKSTGDLVGHAVCNWHWDPHCPWVSLVIASGQQRQGLGSEVLRTLLAHVFERTPAHTVHGGMAGWNVEGLAFALANGFTECGRVPRAGLRDGAYYDDIFVDLLRREWAVMGGEVDAA